MRWPAEAWKVKLAELVGPVAVSVPEWGVFRPERFTGASLMSEISMWYVIGAAGLALFPTRKRLYEPSVARSAWKSAPNAAWLTKRLAGPYRFQTTAVG